jgi:hypothetical protein
LPHSSGRIVALIGVAFLAALLLAPAGSAESCLSVSIKDKLEGAQVAFVGQVVSVKPVAQSGGIGIYDYRFDVLRAVKGQLGATATVRAAKLVDIDAQVVAAGSDVAIGVLASRGRGHLVTSSCSLVDPGSLLGAADEPKGGLIKVAIGLVILGIVLAYSIWRLQRRRHVEGRVRPEA